MPSLTGMKNVKADTLDVVGASTQTNVSISGTLQTTDTASLDKGFVFDTTVSVLSGAGSPEGVKTAPIGSIYLRTDGGANTCLYVKESGTGNSGWDAK